MHFIIYILVTHLWVANETDALLLFVLLYILNIIITLS